MEKLSPITPGEILQEEFLTPYELNISRLAMEIQVPAGRISQIVQGKREITIDTASRLARIFNTTAQFWLNLQAEYNLRVYQDKSEWKLLKSKIKPLKFSNSKNFKRKSGISVLKKTK